MQPRFVFLPFDKLEDNVDNLLEKVEKNHQEKNTAIGIARGNQLNLLKSLFNKLKKTATDKGRKIKRSSNEEKTEKKYLSDDDRAKIATGILLNIKKEIEIEYSGLLNKMIGMVVSNVPQNSTLYSGIDEAIGINEMNVLDEASEKEARLAAAKFGTLIQEVNEFDRQKLKKLNQLEVLEFTMKTSSEKEVDHIDTFENQFAPSKVNPAKKSGNKKPVALAVKQTPIEPNAFYDGLRSKGEQYKEHNAALTNEVLRNEKINRIGLFSQVHADIRDKTKTLNTATTDETHEIRVSDDQDVKSKPIQATYRPTIRR